MAVQPKPMMKDSPIMENVWQGDDFCLVFIIAVQFDFFLLGIPMLPTCIAITSS